VSCAAIFSNNADKYINATVGKLEWRWKKLATAGYFFRVPAGARLGCRLPPNCGTLKRARSFRSGNLDFGRTPAFRWAAVLKTTVQEIRLSVDQTGRSGRRGLGAERAHTAVPAIVAIMRRLFLLVYNIYLTLLSLSRLGGLYSGQRVACVALRYSSTTGTGTPFAGDEDGDGDREVL